MHSLIFFDTGGQKTSKQTGTHVVLKYNHCIMAYKVVLANMQFGKPICQPFCAGQVVYSG